MTAVDEAAARQMDPALRKHKQRGDRRGEQGQEKTESLQGRAVHVNSMTHQDLGLQGQRLPEKNIGESPIISGYLNGPNNNKKSKMK